MNSGPDHGADLPTDSVRIGASQHLANFVVDSRWQDIPAQGVENAVRAIFNGFGTALGGSSDAATLRLLETLSPFSGDPTSTVIGNRARADMPTAAFLNAVSTNVFDFDDTHHGTIIHPTAPVSPALFAFAERNRVSGQELLHAFVLGVEVECRLGNVISPMHYSRGWHITATCGVFGAAAAVGKLLGLDRRQMLWAFGNASAQASGLVETLGSMAKSIGVGNAARNGLLAALMARNGVEGPELPLEGPRGFLQVTCDRPNISALTVGLSQSWELDRNMCKPYPCGVVLNPVIDACLLARKDARFAIDAIDSVAIAGSALLRDRANRPNVSTGREAQVSAQHAIAVSLLRGTAGIADFNDEAVQDREVLALRSLVGQIAIDPEMNAESAELTITLRGGGVIRVVVNDASGSLTKPLSDAQIESKFRSLAAYGCPELDPESLIRELWRLEHSVDAGAIMRHARPR